MTAASPISSVAPLDGAISRATHSLLAAQRQDGHFVFEFEADATIPAEYVLMVHYLGETPNSVLEAKIGNYLCRIQNPDGGWPLFHQGVSDISASVKAYFALKMIGDGSSAEHMRRARQAILMHGGAEKSNVFTRFLLALYGIVGWHAVPVMPVEIMLLPKWFPFHIYKISYWARTVLIPLLVLQALKPAARNPRRVTIEELFLSPPQALKSPSRAPHQNRGWFAFFSAVDAALRVFEPAFSSHKRKRAIAQAVEFVRERLNGEHGLGAIFPAMVNNVMMLDALGLQQEYAIARHAVEKLVIERQEEAYCQPCVSPVWDSALASHALFEAGARSAAMRTLSWLLPRQVTDHKGDWAATRPHVRPGGWAFQYENAHYPDLDDTAVTVMAMERARSDNFRDAILRGCEWIEGMQSRNGGWASFDADNTYEYLNHIPFADHGALLDPPTADVTARCVSMLAQLGKRPQNSLAARRGVEFLLRTQENDGSWFGRWGINYIYGTWSALSALNAAGIPHDAEPVKKAADWLLAIQNGDGGWGEEGSSYKLDYSGYEKAPSMPSQTAWALLGLMAVGRMGSAVERGIGYLQRIQMPDGGWRDVHHNAPGFPRVFYLRYHGYAQYFPLLALARYRNLLNGSGAVYGL